MMTDAQAAALYFKHWRLVESSSEDMAETDATMLEIDAELKENGYPLASSAPYVPELRGVWKDPNFDYHKWVAANWDDLETAGD